MDAHLFEELLASVHEMDAILKGKAEPSRKTLIASELDVSRNGPPEDGLSQADSARVMQVS